VEGCEYGRDLACLFELEVEVDVWRSAGRKL
jgi:hypothetical protein